MLYFGVALQFKLTSVKRRPENKDKNPAEVVLYPRLCFIQGHCLIELIGRLNYYLRRLERVFRCCSACETMEDYKKGCLMVWANYMSPGNSITGLYFKAGLT